MLDRSEEACRQLATRARRAVRDERPAPAATPDNHARLLMAFGEAVTSALNRPGSPPPRGGERRTEPITSSAASGRSS